MNFYSYWKAERSPGLKSSRHSIEMTLYSVLQQIQHSEHFELPAETERVNS